MLFLDFDLSPTLSLSLSSFLFKIFSFHTFSFILFPSFNWRYFFYPSVLSMQLSNKMKDIFFSVSFGTTKIFLAKFFLHKINKVNVQDHPVTGYPKTLVLLCHPFKVDRTGESCNIRSNDTKNTIYGKIILFLSDFVAIFT